MTTCAAFIDWVKDIPADNMKNLYEKALKGDEQAEKELFQSLFVRFRLFAEQKVDEEIASEIAQQACVTVLEKYRTETFKIGFQAWAYGILKMTLLSYHRDKSREKERQQPFCDDFKLPQSKTPHPMLRHHLMDCIGQLVKSYSKYARILNLHYQGYSTDEICQRLKLKPEQYYVYVTRGRSLLRDCLIQKGVLT